MRCTISGRSGQPHWPTRKSGVPVPSRNPSTPTKYAAKHGSSLIGPPRQSHFVYVPSLDLEIDSSTKKQIFSMFEPHVVFMYAKELNLSVCTQNSPMLI